MGKIITLLASLAAVAVLSGCNGVSASSTQTSASSTQTSAGSTASGNTQTEIPGRGEYYRKPGNKAPVAYAGRDRKVEIGDTNVKITAKLIPDQDGDKLAYIWTLTDKPVGSQADITTKYSTSRQTTLDEIDEFGNYTVALLVRDENGGTGADTIHFSTTLHAYNFDMVVDDSNVSSANWKDLSHLNNQAASAEIIQDGAKGEFVINGNIIGYQTNQLGDNQTDSAILRIWDDADEITITVTVIKKVTHIVEKMFTNNCNGYHPVDHWKFIMPVSGELTINMLSELYNQDWNGDGVSQGIDLYIRLYEEDPTQPFGWREISANDDCSDSCDLEWNTDGSESTLDSFLRVNLTGGKKYLLAVSRWSFPESYGLKPCNHQKSYQQGPYRITFSQGVTPVLVPAPDQP